MIRSEKAIELFNKGFTCSQSVLSVFCEKYGMEIEQALKLACGFGGGIRSGEVCGVVTGAVMVIGLKYGHYQDSDNEKKQLCFSKTKEFIENFKTNNKSIICRELLGIDIFKGEGMQKASELNLFNTKCVDLIDQAVTLLEELGY